MRLVDADELLKPVGCYNTIKYTDEYGEVVKVEDITSMPTVDAEPIRHGHWIEHSWNREKKECSVCGSTVESTVYLFGHARTKGTPYCPWCGALMDEVEEDEID